LGTISRVAITGRGDVADPHLTDDAEQKIGLFPRWAAICDHSGYHTELRSSSGEPTGSRKG
jgi:hypothetical protein